jgi:hypothetical protein
MHALDHGAVLRRHQPGRLRAGDAERMHGLLGRKPQAPRRAGGGRVDAHGGAGMPALADVLRAHALADARADLVAGDRGGEKVAAGQGGVALRHGDQRRQGDRADMQHAVAMDVVELEALDLRAVDQRRVRRGQACRRAPDRGGAGDVQCRQRRLQDAAPFEVGAVDRAAERIEDQELDALAHLGRNGLVAERRDERGDRAGMDVIGGRHARP